jgi:hypothetical protein
MGIEWQFGTEHGSGVLFSNGMGSGEMVYVPEDSRGNGCERNGWWPVCRGRTQQCVDVLEHIRGTHWLSS